jgi:hypothetical protein
MKKEKEKEKEEYSQIRENIKCIIDGCNKSFAYFDYEMNMFIFFVEKYSNIIYEYSEEIFFIFAKYFENLYKIFMKSSCENFYDNNNYNYCLKYLSSILIPKEKIYNLFEVLFRNKKNIIDDKNICYYSFAMTGHDIIKCYISSGGKFNENETKNIMHIITLTPDDNIGKSIIEIVNNNDVFAYNDYLLEYSAFLCINEYIKRYIIKNNKLPKKCIENILIYSNDTELCLMIIDYFDDECLIHALKSKNFNIIKLILDNKILINNKKNLLEYLFYFDINAKKIDEKTSDKIKIFEIDKNELFLFSEIDFYQNKNQNIIPLVIRKIEQKNYHSIQEINELLEKYGYGYTMDDYLIAVQNGIFISPKNLDYNNDEYYKKILLMCSQKSFYPYLLDNKYPRPTMDCLFVECGKKNNIRVIKQLVEVILIQPNIKCLQIACSINNNLNVIKYFVEKKSIKPDIICIKNSIISNNKINIIHIDDNILKNMNIIYNNNITDYLYKKYNNKKN